jgi:Glycosyl hydrolases family 6.
VESLARGVGDAHAIMFEEMDSLITVGCLSKHGLAVRLAMLRDANQILSQVPHLVVYEDAGAADGPQSARYMASLLRRAGVSLIQGFFLNSTHFDWTLHEIQYGNAISRLIGGKHFVVNTAENGRGPPHPRDRVHQGNEVIRPRSASSTRASPWSWSRTATSRSARPPAPGTGWSYRACRSAARR